MARSSSIKRQGIGPTDMPRDKENLNSGYHNAEGNLYDWDDERDVVYGNYAIPKASESDTKKRG